MALDPQTFFQATDPGIPLFIDNAEIDNRYYIDFSTVRGGQVIKKLQKTILWSSGRPTCQLFTGHIGCGKSTELWRLKQQLEIEGFHVVYVESDKNLEMGDVDVGDILLTIVQQVSESLEELKNFKIKEPNRLKGILQGAAKLLKTEIKISNIELSFGIGKITAEAKASPEVRSKLREYLGPRTSGIIETINQELFEPANKKLKQYDKKGLVVIVDNLDKVDNTIKYQNKTQPEYLFVDRGEQLAALHCHVIYTIPLALRFSNDLETLIQRFKKSPQVLPMVATQLRDGNECAEGMELVRQLVLARAFPELDPQQRLAKVTEIFDSQETLDYLCRFSGGHVRNVLRIVNDAIMEEDKLPISHSSVKNIIRSYRNERVLAIDDREWELLRRVARTKKVSGDDGYQTLIRSMFVYEYQDETGSWFDINPILKDVPELKNDRN
ncbi:MAG: ATP-binding protein [Okeania sp. SIO3B3]|nr:ATP-binding protein [Okeania sp. SIO3B3]